jgi:hypothetical protein
MLMFSPTGTNIIPVLSLYRNGLKSHLIFLPINMADSILRRWETNLIRHIPLFGNLDGANTLAFGWRSMEGK